MLRHAVKQVLVCGTPASLSVGSGAMATVDLNTLGGTAGDPDELGRTAGDDMGPSSRRSEQEEETWQSWSWSRWNWWDSWDSRPRDHSYMTVVGARMSSGVRLNQGQILGSAVGILGALPIAPPWVLQRTLCRPLRLLPLHQTCVVQIVQGGHSLH